MWWLVKKLLMVEEVELVEGMILSQLRVDGEVWKVWKVVDGEVICFFELRAIAWK